MPWVFNPVLGTDEWIPDVPISFGGDVLDPTHGVRGGNPVRGSGQVGGQAGTGSDFGPVIPSGPFQHGDPGPNDTPPVIPGPAGIVQSPQDARVQTISAAGGYLPIVYGKAKYAGLTVLNNKGARHFNGVVRCVPEALGIPLKWRRPRRVFVNSMSDLFHKNVPFAFVDRVFAVMALCPRHTFQVLTKRPERMAEYFASFENDVEVDGVTGLMRLGHAAGQMLDGDWIWGEGKRHRRAIEQLICDAYEEDVEDESEPGGAMVATPITWPLRR